MASEGCLLAYFLFCAIDRRYRLACASSTYRIDFIVLRSLDPDGTPSSVSSVVYAMKFSERKRGRFHRVHGSQEGEAFFPEENPSEPTEPPFATFSSTFEGQRVTLDQH